MGLGFSLLTGFLIAQRLSELHLSRRNERWLRSMGAREVKQSHYPYLITMHVAFFLSLVIEVQAFHRSAAGWWWIPCLALLAAQSLRLWSMVALGRRWTTRIFVLPDTPPVTHGPYRYLRHPNYLAVAIELLAVPLIFRAYFTALVFTILNAILLAIHIPAEARALRGEIPA